MAGMMIVSIVCLFCGIVFGLFVGSLCFMAKCSECKNRQGPWDRE